MSQKQPIPALRPKGRQHAPGSLAAALTGQGYGACSAPAHPFDANLGSGIRWTPDGLEVWLRDEPIDKADIATLSPMACWHDLAFIQAFPNVTHWWFGSAWTQRVRGTAATQQPNGSQVIFLQAIQEDADELPWIVQPDGTAEGPLPAYSGGTVNLPLQLGLGQLARLIRTGEIAIGQWAIVTSLVAAAELPALVSTDRRADFVRRLGLER